MKVTEREGNHVKVSREQGRHEAFWKERIRGKRLLVWGLENVKSQWKWIASLEDNLIW